MSFRPALIVVLSLLGASIGRADITIDFEGISESTSITNQFPGVQFTNAVVFGPSLNSAEFPPHSGINVVLDIGGPIRIDFLAPVSDFHAFLTYTVPVTATAFNASNVPVDSVTSQFAANFTSTGNPPNEEFSLSSAAGISSVVLAGDPNGASFAMDDVMYSPLGSVAAPEASSGALVAGLLTVLVFWKGRSLRSAERRG
jgi:hypothetical protein